MKKKFIVSLLLSCIIISAFTACSSSNEESSKVTGTVSVADSSKSSKSVSEDESSDEVSKEESSEQSSKEIEDESKEESKENSEKEDSAEQSSEISKEESKDESSEISDEIKETSTEISNPVSSQISSEPVQQSQEQPSYQPESSVQISEPEIPVNPVVSEPVQQSYEEPEPSQSQPDVLYGDFDEEDVNFYYNNTAIKPNEDISSVISKIGNASKIDSAPSCIGVGEDKIYSYNGFKIESYPDTSGEKVLNIMITDNSVSTSKGISVGMTVADIENAYGTSKLDKSISDEYFYTYVSGKLHLDFLIDDGLITEIDYVYDVNN